MPDNIKRRQATQTIATAPEPSAWLLRTEWPAQLAADAHQDCTVHPHGGDSTLQSPPWFVNPMKATVMSQEDCQTLYPHMKLVSHVTECVLQLRNVLPQCSVCLRLSVVYANGVCLCILYVLQFVNSTFCMFCINSMMLSTMYTAKLRRCCMT